MIRRDAHWAGRFYPSGRDELAALVDDLIGRWPADGPAPWALVVPHAGFVYSGATAAAAYARLRAAGPRRLILIGPSHHYPVNGFALTRSDVWSSPLGDYPVDAEAVSALLDAGPPFSVCEEAHAVEHALEVQLPFLLRAAPAGRLLPILMGRCEAEDRERALQALRRIEAPGDVWLISTDLSHFHTRAEAEVLDGELERIVAEGDAAAFSAALRAGVIEACGGGPLQLLLEARAERGGAIEILHRCDSSDASGDTTQVVGYLAAAFLKG